MPFLPAAAGAEVAAGSGVGADGVTVAVWSGFSGTALAGALAFFFAAYNQNKNLYS